MADSKTPIHLVRTRWFDRKFAPIDKGHLHWLVERLRGTPARLEERTRDLEVDSRTLHVDGRWSILDNVGHLGDLEPLWMGRFEDFEADSEMLREADLTNARTQECCARRRPAERPLRRVSLTAQEAR